MSGVIYFKFRGTLQHEQVVFDGHFITVGELKRLIAEKKGLGRDGAAELILSDHGGTLEYKDDDEQLHKTSKVSVRRGPLNRPKPLVGATPLPAVTPTPATTVVDESTEAGAGDDDVFGGDVFADQAAALDAELQRIGAVGEAEARAQQQAAARDSMAGAGRGRGGPGGRLGAEGRGGRGAGPPATYRCNKCAGFGHWQRDCPANEDPSLEVRRIRNPAGIPVTMLRRNADGSLVLPNGEVGALAPSNKAFEAATAAYRSTTVAPAPVAAAPVLAPASLAAPALVSAPPSSLSEPSTSAAVALPVAAQAMTAELRLPEVPMPAIVPTISKPEVPRSPVIRSFVPPSTPEAVHSAFEPLLNDPDRPPAELFGDEDEPTSISHPPMGLSLGMEQRNERTSRRPGRSPSPFMQPLGELVSRGVLPPVHPQLLVEAFAGPPLSKEEFERLKASRSMPPMPGLVRGSSGRRRNSRSHSRSRGLRSKSRSWSRERHSISNNRRSRSKSRDRRRSRSRERTRERTQRRSRSRSREHKSPPLRGGGSRRQRSPVRSPARRPRSPVQNEPHISPRDAALPSRLNGYAPRSSAQVKKPADKAREVKVTRPIDRTADRPPHKVDKAAKERTKRDRTAEETYAAIPAPRPPRVPTTVSLTGKMAADDLLGSGALPAVVDSAASPAAAEGQQIEAHACIVELLNGRVANPERQRQPGSATLHSAAPAKPSRVVSPAGRTTSAASQELAQKPPADEMVSACAPSAPSSLVITPQDVCRGTSTAAGKGHRLEQLNDRGVQRDSTRIVSSPDLPSVTAEPAPVPGGVPRSQSPSPPPLPADRKQQVGQHNRSHQPALACLRVEHPGVSSKRRRRSFGPSSSSGSSDEGEPSSRGRSPRRYATDARPADATAVPSPAASPAGNVNERRKDKKKHKKKHKHHKEKGSKGDKEQRKKDQHSSKERRHKEKRTRHASISRSPSLAPDPRAPARPAATMERWEYGRTSDGDDDHVRDKRRRTDAGQPLDACPQAGWRHKAATAK